MKLYKLTDAEGMSGTTMAFATPTQWGEGVEHTVGGEGRELCSADLIHAYRDPLVAVMMDPAQGRYGPDALLWECEGEVVADDGTKVGCKTLRTLRRVDLPTVTRVQRVRFGILAAQEIPMSPRFAVWAEKWLSGEDRSAVAARVVSGTVRAVEATVAWAAAVPGARDAALEVTHVAEDALLYKRTIDLVALAHKAVEDEGE